MISRGRHAEAGHALVGCALGLDRSTVTIEANRAEMEVGHAIIADPWVTISR